MANLKRKTLRVSSSPVVPKVNDQSSSALCEGSFLPDVLLLDAKSTSNSRPRRITSNHVENRDVRFVPDGSYDLCHNSLLGILIIAVICLDPYRFTAILFRYCSLLDCVCTRRGLVIAHVWRLPSTPELLRVCILTCHLTALALTGLV